MMLLAASEWAWWATDLAVWSIVVFVVILAILGRYAAGPIVRSMRARQERIESILAQARLAQQEAAKARAAHEEARARLRIQVKALLDEAQRDAVRSGAELVAAAKREAERLEQRANRDIRLAEQRAVHELWIHATELASRFASSLVRHAASPDDHHRLIERAMAEMGQAMGAGR